MTNDDNSNQMITPLSAPPLDDQTLTPPPPARILQKGIELTQGYRSTVLALVECPDHPSEEDVHRDLLHTREQLDNGGDDDAKKWGDIGERRHHSLQRNFFDRGFGHDGRNLWGPVRFQLVFSGGSARAGQPTAGIEGVRSPFAQVSGEGRYGGKSIGVPHSRGPVSLRRDG